MPWQCSSNDDVASVHSAAATTSHEYDNADVQQRVAAGADATPLVLVDGRLLPVRAHTHRRTRQQQQSTTAAVLLWHAVSVGALATLLLRSQVAAHAHTPSIGCDRPVHMFAQYTTGTSFNDDDDIFDPGGQRVMRDAHSLLRNNRQLLHVDDATNTNLRPRTPHGAQHKCFTLDSDDTIDELCRTDINYRGDAYRHVYFIIGNGASDNVQYYADSSGAVGDSNEISLYDLFMYRLIVESASRKWGAGMAADMNTIVFERSIVNARLSRAALACVRNTGTACRDCLTDVRRLQAHIRLDYAEFMQSIMERVDCRLSGPTTTLSRFTSNSTCSHCSTWYKKWLLVSSGDDEVPRDRAYQTAANSTRLMRLWSTQAQPCWHWCHYAELACPFFNRYADNQYAGLPVFRCIDPVVRQRHDSKTVIFDDTDPQYCKCIHPCDLSLVDTVNTAAVHTSEGNCNKTTSAPESAANNDTMNNTSSDTADAFIREQLMCAQRDTALYGVCQQPALPDGGAARTASSARRRQRGTAASAGGRPTTTTTYVSITTASAMYSVLQFVHTARHRRRWR